MKVDINGLTVDMSIDEFIEYNQKMTQLPPAFEPEKLEPKEAESLPVIDVEEVPATWKPIERHDFETRNKNRNDGYDETSRNTLKKIREYGYTNSSLTRATVIGAHLYDKRLGASRSDSLEYLMNLPESEKACINSLVHEVNRITQLIERRHKRHPIKFALGAALWWIRVEFGYEQYEVTLSRSWSP